MNKGCYFFVFIGLLLCTVSQVFSQNSFQYSLKKAQVAYNDVAFEEAIGHFQNAISSFTTENDSTKLGYCYLYLGKIHGQLENLDKAEKYTKKAEKIFIQTNNDSLLISSIIVLGNLFSLKKQYPKAKTYFENALQLADSLHLKNTQISLLNNLGVTNYNLKNYLKAIQFYKKSLAIAKAQNNKKGIGLALMNIGISYSELEENSNAIKYLEQGIEIAKQINELYSLQLGYEQLSNLYLKLKNYKKAYRYLNLYVKTKESLASQEKSKRILELEAKFNSQQKQLEILKLKEDKHKHQIASIEKENKIESLKLIIIAILCTLGILLIVSFFYVKQYKNKLSLSQKLQKNKLKLEQKNKQLSQSLALNKKMQVALNNDLTKLKQQSYRKQMNPHFIFNALNTVQNYILTNNRLEANFYLGELSMLIRRVLENSEKNLISLKEEMFVCETYIKLEKKRFDGKFKYIFSKSEGLDLSKIRIPPLLLQPFIENAIWHGLLHKENNAVLEIKISAKTESTTVISIKDNGVGRNKTLGKSRNENKKKSMGINLTKERIKITNCIFNHNIDLAINDLKNEKNKALGTEIIITLQK